MERAYSKLVKLTRPGLISKIKEFSKNLEILFPGHKSSLNHGSQICKSIIDKNFSS